MTMKEHPASWNVPRRLDSVTLEEPTVFHGRTLMGTEERIFSSAVVWTAMRSITEWRQSNSKAQGQGSPSESI